MLTSRGCWLTSLILFLTLSSYAQCNDWDKLIQYENVMIYDVTRDNFGNLYIVGSFYIDDFTLGPYPFELPTEGAGAFIAKFDKDYSVVWATSPTSPWAFAMEVELDRDGNVVVAGQYHTAIEFGCITLNASGRADIFVVSYTKNGIPRWATASSGADDEFPKALTVSPNGNLILAATFVEKSDPSNEYFILPELGQPTSLAIYNRWGDRIFYTSDYKNNWPQTDLSSGVYYYSLGGMCIPGAKGAIHLMR